MASGFVQTENWLIEATKLKPGEYLQFPKGRLASLDIRAALEKQFPGPMHPKTSSLICSYLDVSTHGSRVTVWYPNAKGCINPDACIWEDPELLK